MMKTHEIAGLTGALTGVMSFLAAPVMAFSVGATHNIETLKNNLLGTNTAGLSNFSVSITGNEAAFGTFSNDPFGLQSGVVLSTGRVADIAGRNLKDNVITNGFDLNTDFGPKGTTGDLTQLNISFFANNMAEKLLFEYDYRKRGDGGLEGVRVGKKIDYHTYRNYFIP